MINPDRAPSLRGFSRCGQPVEARSLPEDDLARMRRCLIQANWCWSVGDDEGAIEHELEASIALNHALNTLRG